MDGWDLFFPQVAVQQLRERLSRALGQHGSAPIHNRHPVSRAAVPQQTYTQVQPQTQPLPPQPTPAAPTQQYYQQVLISLTHMHTFIHSYQTYSVGESRINILR